MVDGQSGSSNSKVVLGTVGGVVCAGLIVFGALNLIQPRGQIVATPSPTPTVTAAGQTSLAPAPSPQASATQTVPTTATTTPPATSGQPPATTTTPAQTSTTTTTPPPPASTPVVTPSTPAVTTPAVTTPPATTQAPPAAGLTTPAKGSWFALVRWMPKSDYSSAEAVTYANSREDVDRQLVVVDTDAVSLYGGRPGQYAVGVAGLTSMGDATNECRSMGLTPGSRCGRFVVS